MMQDSVLRYYIEYYKQNIEIEHLEENEENEVGGQGQQVPEDIAMSNHLENQEPANHQSNKDMSLN